MKTQVSTRVLRLKLKAHHLNSEPETDTHIDQGTLYVSFVVLLPLQTLSYTRRSTSTQEKRWMLMTYEILPIYTTARESPRALPKCAILHFCGVGKTTRRAFDSAGSVKHTVETGSWDCS